MSFTHNFTISNWFCFVLATVFIGDFFQVLLPGEKAIQPVGNEYIEESFDAAGKLITFYCKLCDCKFNDPNAKNMHMKGRRHRTNYKKKVDPNLVVEVRLLTKGRTMSVPSHVSWDR